MTSYWELGCEMSKTELRELENRLTVLIEHLLKIAHVAGKAAEGNVRGWNQTVRYQRRDLAKHVEQNRGLKSKLNPALLDKVYGVALTRVKNQYPSVSFPSTRCFSLQAILGPDTAATLN